MFDKKTLHIAAPVRIIDNCGGGIYLVCHYNKSARFRINQVRGANVALSAIFFGERQ